ncbi:MAG: rRNA pseudouridine synthase [Enterococcaceae bacterium]|jgi:16S rRNA pseudouridine516 synthase|nr:rRNA pseudouridine synthase [Enterococcaceae bacterium]
MRLDRFLSETGLGTRSQVKALLKTGQVSIDGKVAKNGKTQVDPLKTSVAYQGEVLHYQKFYYYLLNKPQGVLSATRDPKQKTALDLLSAEDYRKDLFPVGRLDKDTEGLLLLTNDGKLAHELLSPKKHVDKEYYAKIAGAVTPAMIDKFALGFLIDGDEKVRPSELVIEKTDPAKNTSEIRLTIREGKFHQVKRMFEAFGMTVTYLKRTRMGGLVLGDDLQLGEYRPLSEDEVGRLGERE